MKTTLSSLLFILMIMAFNVPIFAEVDEAPTRDKIDDKYKWDLSTLFVNDDASSRQ